MLVICHTNVAHAICVVLGVTSQSLTHNPCLMLVALTRVLVASQKNIKIVTVILYELVLLTVIILMRLVKLRKGLSLLI